jgi:RHS repeat-associated protein
VEQPAGAWTQSYAHDPAGRLNTVQSPAGSFAYDYPKASPTSGWAHWNRLRLPNNATILRTHDPLARLQRTELFNPAGQRLNAHAYGYDTGFRRLSMQRTDQSRVHYQYDPAGQLTQATGTGGESTEASSWQYDPAGNLVRRTRGAVTEIFGVNARNELTSTPQGTCLYDANGNLIRHNFEPDGSRFHEYAYDDENRLVLAGTDYYQTPAAQRWRSQFVYDGLGRLRVRRDYTAPQGYWQPNGESRYLYDGQLIVQERSAANLPTASYTRALDLAGSLQSAGGIGGLLAQSSQYSTSTGAWGQHDFPHADAGGNITYLLRNPQTFSSTYRYDPFGTLTHASGRGLTSHLFSSKPRHPPSGLYPYGHRFYHPDLQRWLNPDPLGENGGLNLYTFVDNDPLNYVDPLGLSQIPNGAFQRDPRLPPTPDFPQDWPVSLPYPDLQDPRTTPSMWACNEKRDCEKELLACGFRAMVVCGMFERAAPIKGPWPYRGCMFAYMAACGVQDRMCKKWNEDRGF